MNLIFLSIFEEFQNFFKDGFLSKINTEGLEGSNARELVKSYFENKLDDIEALFMNNFGPLFMNSFCS